MPFTYDKFQVLMRLECLKEHPHHFSDPVLVFIFSRGVSKDVAEFLEGMVLGSGNNGPLISGRCCSRTPL